MITVWNRSEVTKAIKVKGGFETVKPNEIKSIDTEMTATTKDSFASQKVLVEDGDKVKKLTARRDKVVAQDQPAPEEVAKEKNAKEIEALRERARELGLKPHGNWGIPKLQHEIQQAEADIEGDDGDGETEGVGDQDQDDDDEFAGEGDGEEE